MYLSWITIKGILVDKRAKKMFGLGPFFGRFLPFFINSRGSVINTRGLVNDTADW